MSQDEFLKGSTRLYERYPDVKIQKNGNKLKIEEEPLIVGESYELEVRIAEKSIEQKEFDNLIQTKDEIETLRRKKKANKVEGIAFTMWGALSIIFSYLAVNFTDNTIAFGPVNIPLVPFVFYIIISFFCGTTFYIANAIKDDTNVADIGGILIYTIVFFIFGGLSFVPLAIAWLILNYFQMNTYLSMYFGMIFPAFFILAGLLGLFVKSREFESQINNIESQKIPKYQIKGLLSQSIEKAKTLSWVGDFIFSKDIELLVVARAKDIEINPEFGNLYIPKTGPSKSITFELLPKLDGGEKSISISFFYENNFYGEISQNVKTEAKKWK